MSTKLQALVTDSEDYQSGYFDASALGILDTQSTSQQSVAGSLAFGDNKKITLTANNGGLNGGIAKLIDFRTPDRYARPAVAWYDRLNVLRAALYWHETDFNSGQDHNAVELKSNALTDPNDMRTRFSIGSGADRTLAGLNYLTFLELNQGEPVVSTPFGLRLRGHLQDGSANGVVAQFLAQQDASDNVTAFLDVNPVTSGAAKGVTLTLFRNTNTTVAAGVLIAVKRGNGTNDNAYLLSPKLGTIAVIPTGAVGSSTSTGGALNIDNTASTGAGLVMYTNQDDTALGPLASFRVDNAAFDQRALSVDYSGATHGVFIYHKGVGNASIGLNVTSENVDDTAFGVSGRESGRGTIKTTHFKPDGVADTNASAISINLDRVNAGETSAAQMIFGDTTHAFAVTTKMVQLRSNGSQKFSVYHDGTWEGAEVASDPAAPAANFGKAYFRDNGSGKTQFVARFPTGAVQVIATEP